MTRTASVYVCVTTGYPLSQFVTYCADHYLTSEHKDVRLEAVKTCSHLLTPSLNVSHFVIILMTLIGLCHRHHYHHHHMSPSDVEG